jgi:hypothetical protein
MAPPRFARDSIGRILREIAPSRARESKAGNRIYGPAHPEPSDAAMTRPDLFAFEERFMHEGCYPEPPQGVVCYH